MFDKFGEMNSAVLIESDWNLKPVHPSSSAPGVSRINRIRLEFKEGRALPRITVNLSINRIRLEFKANIDLSYHNGSFGINRIRLEFKASQQELCAHAITVLIESDWNLKKNYRRKRFWTELSINRIRLEFKGKRRITV